MNAPTIIALALTLSTVTAGSAISSYVSRRVESVVMRPVIVGKRLDSFLEWRIEQARKAGIEPVVEKAYTYRDGEQVALLTLRDTEVSRKVVEVLKAEGKVATSEDYVELVRKLQIERMKDGWHRLTPQGHWTANRMASALAKHLKVHVTTTSGDRFNGFTARCCCGWFVGLPKYGRDPYVQIVKLALAHKLGAE